MDHQTTIEEREGGAQVLVVCSCGWREAGDRIVVQLSYQAHIEPEVPVLGP